MPVVDSISAAPSRGDGVVNLSSSLRGALFDLPTADNVNASVFKLNLGERLCLGTADECRANETPSIDVGYAKNITHGKFDGLNLQLTPRAGIRFDDESKSALVGALVRIGDNLREGSEMKSNTWYFFAGADAEAVTYTPNSARRLTSGEFHLQNRIIVGDAQAGLGYKLGEADLALTYLNVKPVQRIIAIMKTRPLYRLRGSDRLIYAAWFRLVHLTKAIRSKMIAITAAQRKLVNFMGVKMSLADSKLTWPFNKII